MDEFHRIRRLPPYVFEQVNRVKAQARNAGADIIDLGMGNPDLPDAARMSWKSSRTRSASRAPTGIPHRGEFPGCAAPRPLITPAGSA